MKSFSKWTIEEVEDEFQLVLEKQSEALNQWLTVQTPPNTAEQQTLTALSEKLQEHVWDWNEEELKIRFIGPLLNLVDFEHNQYNYFFSREIAVPYKNEKLAGTVDFLVASGKRSPKHPFFFIQEYKKEHESSDDPLGQLMVAMVAAQKLNDDGNPLYGAYILGRYWHFTVLSGLTYSVHTGLNAANEDLTRIFGILKNTKDIIQRLFDGKGEK